MKSVTGAKPTKCDSPKTPGGISKSLLTPCRRLGLSRNWKKSGKSPFQSPLSCSQAKQEDELTKKRKGSDDINAPEESPEIQTPTRVEVPRRKKSKILITAINKSLDEPEPTKLEDIVNNSQDNETINVEDEVTQENKEINLVVTPVPLKSKSRSKKIISTKSNIGSPANIKENVNINITTNSNTEETNKTEETTRKSPNNLSKECIVVIQKKIFKKQLQNEKVLEKKEINIQETIDSDSDDIPLNQLNAPKLDKDNDEDEFTTKPKILNQEKTKYNSKSPKINKNTSKSKKALNESRISENSDDDDFVDKRKTIVIKKTYNKVTKPQKAKSTGSITQKDIDDIKARIEMKKKMLLAKSMTEDTKELKDLIKKWQKGCQDALLELMDLMKNKCPDKQNMEYSEILETLKIPPSLVGYDTENDCFLTPNDEDVILARFKD